MRLIKIILITELFKHKATCIFETILPTNQSLLTGDAHNQIHI